MAMLSMKVCNLLYKDQGQDNNADLKFVLVLFQKAPLMFDSVVSVSLNFPVSTSIWTENVLTVHVMLF